MTSSQYQSQAEYRQRNATTEQELICYINEQARSLRRHEECIIGLQAALGVAEDEKHSLHTRLKRQRLSYMKELQEMRAQVDEANAAHRQISIRPSELINYKTDEHICAAWSKLFHDIQGFAIKVYRAVKHGEMDIAHCGIREH